MSAPEAALDIAFTALQGVSGTPAPHAHAVVEALSRAGWLTPPDEIKRLHRQHRRLVKIAAVARDVVDEVAALRAALDEPATN